MNNKTARQRYRSELLMNSRRGYNTVSRALGGNRQVSSNYGGVLEW